VLPPNEALIKESYNCNSYAFISRKSYKDQSVALTPFTGFQPFLQFKEYWQERALLLADLSLASIILAFWLGAFIMFGIGRAQHYPRLATMGAIALGVMTIATPLVPYISGTIQQGGFFEASVFDFALIGVFGFLGGIVAAVGYTRLRVRTKLEDDTKR
jgi:uncharacterized membrane protein